MVRRGQRTVAAVLAAGSVLAAPAVLGRSTALAGPAGAASPPPSAGSAPPARPTVDSFGIRLVDIPVSEAANRRAWRYIIDFLHPGTVIRRRVAIENMTPRPASVRVYADSAVIKGGMFVGGPGQARSEFTGWTSVAAPVLRLAPWATTTDMVTIRVPSDTSMGERYGVIWAQEESAVQRPGHFEITELNRVGVRVYLSVGPGGPPPTNFTITSLTARQAASGAPEVVAQVLDTGRRAIDLSGVVRLSDGPGGASAGPFPFASGLTLAPGQAGPMDAVLSQNTPAGNWRVTVTLQSGITSRQSSAILRLGTATPAGLVLTGRDILGGILIAALALAWFLRRRSSSRERRRV